MSKPTSFLTPADLQAEGFLQEVNRRFFHPLGLALAVEVGEDLDPDGYMRIQIWDYRDDPEGMFFGIAELASDDSVAKALNVTALGKSKEDERRRVAGEVVQSVPFAGFLDGK